MPRVLRGDERRLPGDPDDWTPEIDSIIASYSFHDSSLSQTDHHRSFFTVIHPRTSGRDAPPIHLLGVEMTSIRALPWARGYSLRGDLTRRPGQVELTRFILHWEREALETAGIYKAVFLSLFMYSVDLSFFRGFAERWNYASNTLVLEDREITISLWDLRMISGLPIFGSPYEECSLGSSDLYSHLPDGSFRHPASLQRVYQIYSELYLHKKRKASLEVWLRHFTSRLRRPCREFPHPSDPFGTGTSEIRSHGTLPGLASITSLDIDRETLLTAFLAWWLCYFVIPLPGSLIRPEVFVMANRLAKGEKIR